MLSEATSDAITLSDLYLSRYPYCQGASANTLKGVVLNAFRHHGERDGCWCTAHQTVGWVLNAFRHHGERDLLIGGKEAKGKCAQRLSASRRAGQEPREWLHFRLAVLNAFRHHGERDRARNAPSRPPSGAQRLSASRRAGPAPSATGRWRASAQRLSASRRAGRPTIRRHSL